MKEEILRLEHISKIFSGVRALSDINLSFNSSEVHALVGENGAGKSTMMNIIFGNIRPTDGKVFFRREEVKGESPEKAQEKGIFMIHQEGSLLMGLSVMENIFISSLSKNKFGFLDVKKMYRETKEILKMLDIAYIDPRKKVESLSTAERQLVEIAKAIALHPALVIMDEPTASISLKEIRILMNIIRKLKEQGIGVIYISHKLDEVFEISDTVSVLRDGALVGTYSRNELDAGKLIALMVGRQLGAEMEYIKKQKKGGNREVILEVKDLTVPVWKKKVSFLLKQGEVLGFAGLVGAGRSEVFEALIGYTKSEVGQIVYLGQRVSIQSPADAISQGIGMLSEDRREKGIFAEHSVNDNMHIINLKNLKQGMLLSAQKEKNIAQKQRELLNIKAADLKTKIKKLSGGNQQKVLLARFLSMKNPPKILILDEPTHGIDVGAKAEIYKVVRELVRNGISVILISSELPELMLLCDRILIMYEGEITGEVSQNDFDQELIMQYASNLKSERRR